MGWIDKIAMLWIAIESYKVWPVETTIVLIILFVIICAWVWHIYVRLKEDS